MSETALQKKHRKQRELGETVDYLRQVDLSESQGGGAKIVVDKLKADEAREKDQQDAVKTFLEKDRQKQFTYRRGLADYGNRRIIEQDLPKSWECTFLPTDGTDIKLYTRMFKTQEGIVLVLKAPDGEVYAKAVGVTMDAQIDVANVNMMVVQAENTIDSKKGLLLSEQKTKSGIWTGNS